MSLLLIGLNHRTAPIDLREQLSISPAKLGEMLRRLKNDLHLQELVLLSTCNRLEAYVSSEDPRAAQEAITQALQNQVKTAALDPHLYIHTNEKAVHHLFRVTSGLDSMVVGEHEILGQVKQAYQAAQEASTTGKLMNVLFQRSLYLGKRVRTETGLSIGAASVASVAVSLAQRIFGDLHTHAAMILGAGEMAEQTAKYLLSQKVHSLFVANRTFERACQLAEHFGGSAMHFEDGLKQLADVDIVICSTAAPHPVITPELVEAIMPLRKGRQLFFIDIAVPRDVHPDVHHLDNVYVYNIDDLQSIVSDNQVKREQHVRLAEALIQEKTEEFARWLDAYHSGQGLSLRHADPVPVRSRP